MEIQDFTPWVNFIKSSISIVTDARSAVKDIVSMLPKSRHKKELETEAQRG